MHVFFRVRAQAGSFFKKKLKQKSWTDHKRDIVFLGSRLFFFPLKIIFGKREIEELASMLLPLVGAGGEGKQNQFFVSCTGCDGVGGTLTLQRP
jgi:hypothetical protein